MIKILKPITLFFSINSLILFLIIPFFRWRYTDDFAFAVELEQQNLFKMLLDRYLNWDARFLMPFSILWFAAMKFLHFKVLLFLSSISFLGISYYIIKLFEGLTKDKLSTYNLLVLTALLNGIVFILTYHVHSALTYWISGSLYIHSLFIMMIWLNIYINKKPQTIKFFIFTFIVATLSQNITIGVLILILIDLIYNFNNTQRNYFFQFFAIFFIGIAIATLSPGSFVQLKLMQSASYTSQVASTSIYDYFIHFFKIYIEALKPNLLMFLILPLIYASIYKSIRYTNVTNVSLNIFEKIDLSWNGILSFIHRNGFYFASIFALTIYWPTLIYGYRYYIGFYIFLLIGILFTWFRLTTNNNKINFSFIKVKITILAIITITTIFYSKTLAQSIKVHKFLSERERLLEKNKGIQSITLTVLDYDEFTRTVRTPEITKDPSFFSNSTMSLFYGIDSIYAGDVIKKNQLSW